MTATTKTGLDSLNKFTDSKHRPFYPRLVEGKWVVWYDDGTQDEMALETMQGVEMMGFSAETIARCLNGAKYTLDQFNKEYYNED